MSLAGACSGGADLVQRGHPDGMSTTTSRSLMFSILLHAGVIVVALLLMMPADREQLIVPRTFEIFPGPVPSPSHAPSNPTTSGPEVKFPAVPVSVPLQTSPAEETAEEPVRQPVPVRRAPPVVRTPPERASPRMTAEEFRRQHPSPAKPSVSGPRGVSRTARIDITNVLASASESSSASEDNNLSADYLARLMGKLRAAHEKPDGLDAGLKARVEFSIRSDGTLADVRIVESSGSRAFDESVLAAFLKVRDLGAPPHGASKGNLVTFRTSDGA